MHDTIRYLAEDAPQLINTSKALGLLRGIFGVLLVLAAIGLMTHARKGRLAELSIGLMCLVLIGIVVFNPGVVQTIGASLSGLFTS